jgi:hypothetical protein
MRKSRIAQWGKEKFRLFFNRQVVEDISNRKTSSRLGILVDIEGVCGEQAICGPARFDREGI